MTGEEAMAQRYPIHRDFRGLPTFHMRFSRVPVAAVNAMTRVLRFFQYKPRPDVVVADHRFPGGKDGIRVKVFRPAAAPGNTPRPCLLYLHGGAFFLTYAGPHLNAAAAYAARLDAVVVFVDYPLDPFPVGLDACHDAAMWVHAHAETLGVDAERVLVGGDSAGGALAATLAQRLHDEGIVSFRGQLLIYPVADRSCSTASAREFVEVPIWTAIANRRMWQRYLERYPADSIPPYAAPCDRENIEGLPPAYVELAEFDPLHDEGLAYAQRLEVCGVPVEVNDTKGTVHGYDALAPRNPVSIDAMNRRIAFLRRCLEGPAHYA